MEFLAELLPPSYLVKTENTSKDKNQKSKQYRKMNNAYRSTHSDPNEQLVGVKTMSDWDEVERRSGRDRREDMKCRGRWLESRAEKDRRQLAKAIQIKI